MPVNTNVSGKRARDARLTALDLLASVLDKGAALGDSDLSTTPDPRDRAYARHLAYGVLRWYSALDWIASQLLDKPLKQKDRDVHRLVLLGLYQLWKDGTAGYAAVNETAGCARKLHKPWATGLVNAVLRRFQREQQAILEGLEQSEDRFAHPSWLLRALQQDWPDDWQEVVDANNAAAPLWLRLNAICEQEEMIGNLQGDGLDISRHPSVDSAIRVEPARKVSDLPGFAKGHLSVQDPAAQLAANLLGCESGQRVLDACAAPGGKTCHLLERYPGIELLALDRNPERLEMVADNLKRLGLFGEARLQAADAAVPEAWWDGVPFDRILLDAPCTATGVIRRHPEIKWLRTAEQVDEAISLQASLLDALWPLLRPGGMLLYATCSVLKRENAEQVGNFLERKTDAVAVTLEADWGREVAPGRQILPGEMEMDGFYYARLQKKG